MNNERTKNHLEYNEDGTLKTPLFSLTITEEEVKELHDLLYEIDVNHKKDTFNQVEKWQGKLKALAKLKYLF